MLGCCEAPKSRLDLLAWAQCFRRRNQHQHEVLRCIADIPSMHGSMWMSLLPKLGTSPWLQRAADTSCNTLDMFFLGHNTCQMIHSKFNITLDKGCLEHCRKNIGKVAMQSPCEISEWVQLGLHTIDPELDVLLSFVTILNLACRLGPCDTSDMFLPKE